jgi:sulfur carrier protein ThiS
MGRLARLARRLRGEAPDTIRVRIILRGRIGSGWYDVDRRVAVPAGATLEDLLDAAEREGIPVRAALAESPHLAHTLMWNGERCPVDTHRERRVEADDEIYLLGPLAGG